jgi:hypothetical protein
MWSSSFNLLVNLLEAPLLPASYFSIRLILISTNENSSMLCPVYFLYIILLQFL